MNLIVPRTAQSWHISETLDLDHLNTESGCLGLRLFFSLVELLKVWPLFQILLSSSCWSQAQAQTPPSQPEALARSAQPRRGEPFGRLIRIIRNYLNFTLVDIWRNYWLAKFTDWIWLAIANLLGKSRMVPTLGGLKPCQTKRGFIAESAVCHIATFYDGLDSTRLLSIKFQTVVLSIWIVINMIKSPWWGWEKQITGCKNTIQHQNGNFHRGMKRPSDLVQFPGPERLMKSPNLGSTGQFRWSQQCLGWPGHWQVKLGDTTPCFEDMIQKETGNSKRKWNESCFEHVGMPQNMHPWTHQNYQSRQWSMQYYLEKQNLRLFGLLDPRRSLLRVPGYLTLTTMGTPAA